MRWEWVIRHEYVLGLVSASTSDAEAIDSRPLWWILHAPCGVRCLAMAGGKHVNKNRWRFPGFFYKPVKGNLSKRK